MSLIKRTAIGGLIIFGLALASCSTLRPVAANAAQVERSHLAELRAR